MRASSAGFPAEQLRLAALESFLDKHGLGQGPVSATRIGDGTSNLTYLLRRNGARLVLRRPPPPPLPPSAHDVLREARIQIAVGEAGLPVPRVLAICSDESVLGVPFYLMEELHGVVIRDRLPATLNTLEKRQHLGGSLLRVLVEIHAVDWEARDVTIGRPNGYLERQLRRWRTLWEVNATRDLPACVEVGERLNSTVPDSPPATLVHGDYRLGNMMVATVAPARVVGVLDWEMATIGDPLADLGYLTATWSEPGTPDHPLLLTPATSRPGFPTRARLIAGYAEQTGRDVSKIGWYQALALWKAAVFCEGTYGRYLRGEREDRWSASLRNGVPRLLELAENALA